MKHLNHRLTLALAAATTLLPFAARAQQPDKPWLNPALPTDQRVDALISKMTLEEKVGQMRDHAPAIPSNSTSPSTTGGTRDCTA